MVGDVRMFELNYGYRYADDVNQPVVDALVRLRPDFGAAPAMLDIGCGSARLGGVIRQYGYRVTGIERSDEALAQARAAIDEVLELDLTDHAGILKALGERRFDVLLFGDVLEHLADPLATLRFYRRLLAPHGRIVISLPNIARWDRRLALLFGRFDYAESGVMDRTHLRFFTLRTAKMLAREAGLAIVAVDHAPGIVRGFLPLIQRCFGQSGGRTVDPNVIMQSPAYRLYEQYVLPGEYWLSRLRRELLAFRIVLVVVPSDSD